MSYYVATRAVHAALSADFGRWPIVANCISVDGIALLGLPRECRGAVGAGKAADGHGYSHAETGRKWVWSREGAVGVGDQWHGSYQEAKVQIEHSNIVRNRRKQTAVDNNSYVKQGDPSVSQAIQGSRVAEWANAAQISLRAAASRRKESENHKNKKNT